MISYVTNKSYDGFAHVAKQFFTDFASALVSNTEHFFTKYCRCYFDINIIYLPVNENLEQQSIKWEWVSLLKVIIISMNEQFTFEIFNFLN